MMFENCCFVREEYFKDHLHFQKMLDPGKSEKQSKRTHVCVKIEMDSNTFYIPLRNNLGDAVRKFGRIGFSVPSASRSDAGLDFRYTLIVNDEKYIEPHAEKKLPSVQYAIINSNYERIKKYFSIYIKGYKRAAAKNRVSKEPLFRESSLVNFHHELNIPK